jgi:hypothetical protein
MNTGIVTKEHMTMLRIGARIEESRSYIRNYQAGYTVKELKLKAWDEQWFGFIPESIFVRLIPAFHSRFGNYPEMVNVIQNGITKGLESYDFKMICNFHIQISDPYYRWFSGDYIPNRLDNGLQEITSTTTAVDFNTKFKKNIKANTLKHFAVNLLNSANDTGLLKGTKLRVTQTPTVTVFFLGYLIYTLGSFDFPMADLINSPFIKSIISEKPRLRSLLTEGQHKGWWEYNWDMNMFNLKLSYQTIKHWFKET